MKTQIKKDIENQITAIHYKSKAIHDKYKIEEPMNVKDIEDLKRYAEILKNLGGFLSSIYRW